MTSLMLVGGCDDGGARIFGLCQENEEKCHKNQWIFFVYCQEMESVNRFFKFPIHKTP